MPERTNLTLADIRREVLDDDTVLLEYWRRPHLSLLWALTRSNLEMIHLPKSDEIDAATHRVYELLTARNRRVEGETPEAPRNRIASADQEYAKASANLSRLLLGQVAPLFGRKRILVVEDGSLQYLPFAVLPDPARTDGAPLIMSHEIVSLPSASFLAGWQRAYGARRPAPQLLAVLADPVFDRGDLRGTAKDPPKLPAQLVEDTRAAGMDTGSSIPRLPFSRRELRLILKEAPSRGTLALTDFEVNRSLLLSGRLRDYRIIHIAAHGLLNEDPDLSGLVLSLVDRRGRPRDLNGLEDRR